MSLSALWAISTCVPRFHVTEPQENVIKNDQTRTHWYQLIFAFSLCRSMCMLLLRPVQLYGNVVFVWAYSLISTRCKVDALTNSERVLRATAALRGSGGFYCTVRGMHRSMRRIVWFRFHATRFRTIRTLRQCSEKSAVPVGDGD